MRINTENHQVRSLTKSAIKSAGRESVQAVLTKKGASPLKSLDTRVFHFNAAPIMMAVTFPDSVQSQGNHEYDDATVSPDADGPAQFLAQAEVKVEGDAIPNSGLEPATVGV